MQGRVRMAQIGKRSRRSVNAATESPPFDKKGSRLLHVRDPHTGHRYLIDTGAEISVLPSESRDAIRDGSTLVAANGSSISTYGNRERKFDLGLARDYTWRFTVADVKWPILGADFLHDSGLLVDVRRSRLIDSETALTVGAVYAKSMISGLRFVGQTVTSAFSDILGEFPKVTTPSTSGQLVGEIEHEINTNDRRPVHAKARRLDPVKLESAKCEFYELLRLGIVRRSRCPWASPLHMVLKPSG